MNVEQLPIVVNMKGVNSWAQVHGWYQLFNIGLVNIFTSGNEFVMELFRPEWNVTDEWMTK